MDLCHLVGVGPPSSCKKVSQLESTRINSNQLKSTQTQRSEVKSSSRSRSIKLHQNKERSHQFKIRTSQTRLSVPQADAVAWSSALQWVQGECAQRSYSSTLVSRVRVYHFVVHAGACRGGSTFK
jgi:hypothetical protein